jgi:hypothetical protein
MTRSERTSTNFPQKLAKHTFLVCTFFNMEELKIPLRILIYASQLSYEVGAMVNSILEMG